MSEKKEFYSSPALRTLVVRFKGTILSASEFRLGGAGTYGTDEINDNDEY